MTEEEAAADDSEQFHVLRGPDGSLYMLSDTNLDRHRVPDDVAPALLEAYESQGEVSGFARRDVGSFEILASGPLARSTDAELPPIDTWVDTM